MKTRPRLLLLEDNLLDVELFENWLEDEGLSLELTNVRSKDQFEAAILEGNWDLIVSDRGLPNYDGLSALQFKSRICPNVAFFFFSGAEAEGDFAESCHGSAATAYILKSEPKRLLAAIRAVLADLESIEDSLRGSSPDSCASALSPDS